jgi:hypothetical protein
MTNTADMSDKDYEILAKNIHEALLKAEGHDTIKIEHDVKVEGRSKQRHQIDVYWRFAVAGVTHQTAIECKHYKSPISVGRVRDFFGALEDIGNINGVMVTTQGYQSGAETYAASKGIRLVILRSPTDLDLTGLIQTIIINMTASIRKTVAYHVAIDPDWVAAHAGALEGTHLQVEGQNNEIGLHTSDGLMVRSWREIENSLPTVGTDGQPLDRDVTLKHPIDVQGLYLQIPAIGLVPLKSLCLDYRITDVKDVSRIDFPRTGHYVMQDVQSGDRQFFVDEKGVIRPKPTPRD